MSTHRAHHPFRALRHWNYRLYFIGQLISLSGTWMQTIAQNWLVYRLSGSPVSLGVMNGLSVLPLLPLALFGGSLADRFPRRWLIVITQSLMMGQAFLLAWLTWSGWIQVWHVWVMAMLLAAFQMLDVPARQAFVVEMVGEEDLGNAIALNSSLFNFARIIGPSLAGLVVATLGEAMAFFLNGLSFLAVIAGLLAMRLPASTARRRLSGASGDPLAGLARIRSDVILQGLVSMVGVSAFLSMPYTTLLPVFARTSLRDSAAPVVGALCRAAAESRLGGALLSCVQPEAVAYGLMMGAVGVGAVAGALLAAAYGDAGQRGRMLTWGNLGFPMALLGFSLSRSFFIALGFLVLTGIAFVWQNALANTLIQTHVEDSVRGRVMGVYTLSFQAMMRLGGLQAGLMAGRLGAPATVALGAVVSLSYMIWAHQRYPGIRRLP
ncbi:MFS transporter [Thermoflexus sp.]|uniref:MFS transporter n=1 Tax=Thermoflexus sp. TaxID=1969742 RepID=UPI002ADD97D1|nr:MFS transporter [Thermoflexus sp.]